MAEVPITINGVICDLYGRTITGPVKIVGSAMITGLGVGGGPIIPPGSGGQPPSDAHPAHPIVLPGDPSWGDPHPAHPIVIPPPPTEPPDTGGGEEGVIKPPPPEGGWGYVEPYGWGFFPGSSNPGPKKQGS